MSNLPPGVRESDIPGNRPQDLAYERWAESHQTRANAREIAFALCECLGAELQHELAPYLAPAIFDAPVWLGEVAVELDLIPPFDAEPEQPDRRGE